MRKRFYVFEHQGKEKMYVQALLDAGWRKAESVSNMVKFCLVDFDIKNGRQQKLELMRKRWGIGKFFVYPHAARPNVVNDIYPNWEHTTAQFVVTPAHAEVLKLYGYPKPVYPVGWHLSEIKPFRRTPGYKVLFAPIHPRMSDIDKQTNADTFKILSDLALKGRIKLTIRYIHSLEDSGLPIEQYEHIDYVKGVQNGCTEDIENADVVVSHQTYAYLARALGTPTIMMNEHIPPKDFKLTGEVIYAKNWEMYRHLIQYPLDILNTPDPLNLIQRASEGDEDVREWTANMIGDKLFDANEFVHRINVHT